MKRDPSEQLRHSWDANAAAWVTAVRTGSIESRRLATDAAILQATLACSPRLVLDVGCGEGWLTRALVEQGVDAIGVDAALPLIEAARGSGGAHFERGSYEDLTENPAWLAGPFDAIVCNFSLLEEDLGSLLVSLRHRLHSSGHLLVQTVHPWTASGETGYRDGWRTEHFSSMGEGFTEAMPWFFRTLESWSRLLSESGYVHTRLLEPMHPETNQPLSLLLVVRPLG